MVLLFIFLTINTIHYTMSSTTTTSLITSFCADPVHGEVYRILNTKSFISWFEADQLYSTINLTSGREELDALLSRPVTESRKAEATACLSEICDLEKNLTEPLPGKTSQEYALAVAAWASPQPKKTAKVSNLFAALAGDSDDE